jgi:hypothetical protein
VMSDCVVNPSVMATVTCPVDTTPTTAVCPAGGGGVYGGVLGSAFRI